MVKKFRSFKSRRIIEELCDKYKIKNYSINEDMSVSVDGDVTFDGSVDYSLRDSLYHIPLVFKEVAGNFIVISCDLLSLRGCPEKVGGDFDCSYNNNLSTLEYFPKEIGGSVSIKTCGLRTLNKCPEKINGSFDCSNNKLKSLEFCPKEISGWFYCDSNQLTSIDYFPRVGGDVSIGGNLLKSLKNCQDIINGDFDCSGNYLTTLKLSPSEVNGDFNCSGNELISLIGSPRRIGGDFNCAFNHLTSLDSGPDTIGHLYGDGEYVCDDNKLKSLVGISSGVVEISARENNISSFDGIQPDGLMDFYGNPVDEVLGLFRSDEVEAIEYIQEFDVIQGDKIIKDRLEEVYVHMGLKMPKTFSFYHYKLV